MNDTNRPATEEEVTELFDSAGKALYEVFYRQSISVGFTGTKWEQLTPQIQSVWKRTAFDPGQRLYEIFAEVSLEHGYEMWAWEDPVMGEITWAIWEEIAERIKFGQPL